MNRTANAARLQRDAELEPVDAVEADLDPVDEYGDDAGDYDGDQLDLQDRQALRRGYLRGGTALA